MKKLFSYVLALTLLVSTMSVSFAAPADVTNPHQEQAVDVLMTLGVVNGYEDGTYRPDKTITRAEMAKLVVYALGYKDYSNDVKSSFTDMANHWARGPVEVCVSEGIIKGYPDGNFYPEKPITYNEVATILIRALGWTDEVLKGNWPANYVTKAMDKKLFTNVMYKASEANRGDVALMVFNTLGVPIGTVNQDGNYEETIVENNRRYVEDGKRGYWEDNYEYDTMLRRLDTKTRGYHVVTGEEETDLNVRSKVGTLCEVYQYYPSNDERLYRDEKDVLFMEASTSLKGVFNDKMNTFTTMDGKEYHVRDGDNLTAKSALTKYAVKDIALFLNGEVYADSYFVMEDDKKVSVTGDLEKVLSMVPEAMGTSKAFFEIPVTISAKVSGKTIKELYAVNLWDVTADKLASDATPKQIEKKELLSLDFKLDNDGNIDEKSFDIVGDVEKLEDIKKGDVIYVYEGASEKIRRVAVGNKTLDEVEIVWDDASLGLVKIGDEKYHVTQWNPNFSTEMDSKTPIAGEKVNLKFDYEGVIYWSQPLTAVKNYAVLLSGALNQVDEPKAKLFLADGTVKTFAVADNTLQTGWVEAGTWMPKKQNEPGHNAVSKIPAGTVIEYLVADDDTIKGIRVGEKRIYDENGTNEEVFEKVTGEDVTAWTLAERKINKNLVVAGNIMTSKTTAFYYTGGANERHLSGNYTVVETDKIADKTLDVAFLSRLKMVPAIRIDGGLDAAPVYALFRNFRVIPGNKTNLDLVMAKGDDAWVNSLYSRRNTTTIQKSGETDRKYLTGELFKIVYSGEKIAKLVKFEDVKAKDKDDNDTEKSVINDASANGFQAKDANGADFKAKNLAGNYLHLTSPASTRLNAYDYKNSDKILRIGTKVLDSNGIENGDVTYMAFGGDETIGLDKEVKYVEFKLTAPKTYKDHGNDNSDFTSVFDSTKFNFLKLSFYDVDGDSFVDLVVYSKYEVRR